jgi:hypothetical protein
MAAKFGGGGLSSVGFCINTSSQSGNNSRLLDAMETLGEAPVSANSSERIEPMSRNDSKDSFGSGGFFSGTGN